MTWEDPRSCSHDVLEILGPILPANRAVQAWGAVCQCCGSCIVNHADVDLVWTSRKVLLADLGIGGVR